MSILVHLTSDFSSDCFERGSIKSPDDRQDEAERTPFQHSIHVKNIAGDKLVDAPLFKMHSFTFTSSNSTGMCVCVRTKGTPRRVYVLARAAEFYPLLTKTVSPTIMPTR